MREADILQEMGWHRLHLAQRSLADRVAEIGGQEAHGGPLELQWQPLATVFGAVLNTADEPFLNTAEMLAPRLAMAMVRRRSEGKGLVDWLADCPPLDDAATIHLIEGN